ncbi:MAG: hydrogenase maturation protease [Dehalococcoidia bacterium]|nr:hydrogenase maturation protease [Dehalococcoidia bacterium]
MKKVVLGIGNSILGDDGVAFHVIESLQSDPPPGDVTFTASDVSGLAILDLITEYDEAIIVDAIQTVDGTPGDIYRLELEDFRVTKHTISPHDVDLPTAMELGRILKIKLPSKVSIVAIEIPDANEFCTTLSDRIAAAVPAAVQMTRDILAE